MVSLSTVYISIYRSNAEWLESPADYEESESMSYTDANDPLAIISS